MTNYEAWKSKLVDAIVIAEGGPDAMVRAVQCSVPRCKDYQEARQIALHTIDHALTDWGNSQLRSRRAEFIQFLGSRWAPVGVTNDPTNLNVNWVPNVLAAYAKLIDHSS